MQGEQLKGRTSRASSTSSLGREVRCGCQYYQSDSLLPERQARIGRPSSRTGGMQELPPSSRLPCSEHEYEPIGAPPLVTLHHPVTAPVVQIIDTDVVPVADSDDSIDERGLLPSRLILGGDVILPLDGRIEDVAMEGQELGETIGDTSEEQDVIPQQIQERLEERYLSTPSPVIVPPTPTTVTTTTTPGAESRTDDEVNTNQMDSSALEESPSRRDSRTIPQRLKSQAGKLSSRLRGIQKPNFSFTKRKQKSEKTRTTTTTTTSSGKSDKSRTDKKVPSRMDRIRSSFSERPRFSLPDRPKFNFPDRSKLRLPDKSKFRFPERAKFSMKRPNISLPNALKRKTLKKTSSKEQQQQQRSTDSTIGDSRRNIFDFSTYPRIFEKKSKKRHDDDDDYAATSSPKDSRGQSEESATFPRVRKSYPSTTASWAIRFGEPTFDELDHDEIASAAERMRPWRHPSLEEPRRSLMLEEKDTLAARISWEKSQKKDKPRKPGRTMEEGVEEEEEELEGDLEGELEGELEEEIQYMDYDPDSVEISEGREINKKEKRRENEQPPRMESDWRQSDEEAAVIGDEIFKPVRRTRSLADPTVPFEVGTSFTAVDPRQFEQIQLPSKEEKTKDEEEEIEIEIEEEGYEEEELEEELEELEDRDLSSAHSDREQQQSSGSSCDRRRRGIIEDTGSEEYYPRDNVPQFDKYFQPVNALADDLPMPSIPPKRPARRSLRKRKDDSVESYDVVVPPARVKRERMIKRASDDISDDLYYEERSDSSSRHRVVYQAEFDPNELTKPADEPLDDIVIVKPARRKSRSSLRSQSQVPMESDIISRNIVQNGDVPRQPPIVPTRRKRARGLKIPNGRNEEQLFPTTMCNGRSDKWEENLLVSSRMGIEPIRTQEIHNIILNAQEDDKVLGKTHKPHADTPIPVPPKRRSRSRTISLAQDDDRTSHGAESLPEVDDYVQEEIPQDETIQDSMRDLSGYALVDKRDKPPRPPPPRRRKIREKFATTPRPSPPKRPQRTYSTLTTSTKLKDDLSLEERMLEQQQQQSESMPYIEIDLEDRKELRDDRVLSKIQGRPLPAPPRPPRARKEHSQDRYEESLSEIVNEATTATQTDPLPDDMIIEEEITQAKLIVTPSLSGSQVMVSTERIPSPSHFPTSPEFGPNDDEKYHRHVDTPRSSREPSPFADYHERFQERRSPMRTQFSGEPPPPPTIPETTALDLSQLQSHLQSIIRSALMTDETLRISSLEVGDLKVDRLSVSQLETSKLLASEIDAILISTSELKNLQEPKEDSFSPAIIKELMAIRSHLENVASSQAREERRLLDRESDRESTLKESTKKDVIQDKQEDKVSTKDPLIKSTVDDDKEDSKDAKKKIKIESTDKTESPLSTLSFVESTIPDNETVDSMTTKRLEMLEGKQLSTQIHHSDSKSSLTAEFDLMSERRPEIDVGGDHQDKQVRSKEEEEEEDIRSEISRKSRSRSSSPTSERIRPVRQTASPIRSLPPVISVTPDTPDITSPYNVSNVTQAQHAVISYSEDPDRSSDNQEAPRETSQSPIASNLSSGVTHFIAFPTSQIPEEFLSLVRSSPSTSTRVIESELSILESSRQLLRAIRIVCAKLIRDFASHLVSRVGAEDATGKIRELELALCALLLVIAILLIVYFSNSRTIMHHHHWDYFNPPQ